MQPAVSYIGCVSTSSQIELFSKIHIFMLLKYMQVFLYCYALINKLPLENKALYFHNNVEIFEGG